MLTNLISSVATSDLANGFAQFVGYIWGWNG